MEFNDVRASFAETAADYDAPRRQLIPCFDAFYGTAAMVVAHHLTKSGASDRPHRVLDLGAGSGLLTAWVHLALPGCAFELVDLTAEMLALARTRMDGMGAVAEYRVADYAEAPIDHASGEGWDAVISSLSIHHLDHPGKRRLFGRVLAGLRPGGIFVNAEQIAGANPEWETFHQARWLDAAVAAGVTPRALEQAKARMLHDQTAPLLDQLNWLVDAGFVEVDCWFKELRFGVYGGVRPS